MIYNLETLETSNGIRTNVLQQKLGLVSRTTNTMLGLMQYPQGLGLVSHTTNTMLGLTQYPQGLGLVSHTTNTMLGLTQYPQGLGLVSHTTNMWQISNLQIDSSVIQIVQSEVLRNSIDTTATITNTLPWGCCIYQTKYIYILLRNQITTQTSTPHLEPRAKSQ